MIKAKNLRKLLSGAILSFVAIFILPVATYAATTPPQLSAPTADTYTYVPIAFHIGQPALSGTLKIVFSGSTTITITLDADAMTSNPFRFYVNPGDILASGEIVASTTSNTIPDGTYNVIVMYQNLNGDPAATASEQDVVIDTSDPNLDTDHDSILNVVEDAAPNRGDANDDNIPDSAQVLVASLVNPITENYVSFSSSNCGVSEAGVVRGINNSTKDLEYIYPDGMLDFTLSCIIPCVGPAAYVGLVYANGCFEQSAEATITQYWYGAASSNFEGRKYNDLTGDYATLNNATIEETTIDSQPLTQITYAIVEGGPLDEDGEVNGIIEDPVGLGIYDPLAARAAAGVTDSPESGALAETGSNILTNLIVGSTLLSAAFVLSRVVHKRTPSL